ncbi:MAG: CBS domain-containing protein [Bacillota bacterium]|nr:CBS domain-containing protein [Bacillota bacterium]
MNILFFLTPKSEVAYLYDTDSLRQALEKMENHRYSAIPIISKGNGRYIGTLTEGDLLWNIKDSMDLSLRDAENISIMEVKRNRDNEPVNVDVDMEDLINKSMNQNFVPVIDGGQHFIGIIKRKDIIQYLSTKLAAAKQNQ